MANCKRIVTDAPNHATSQRPDPTINTAPSQPSPTKIPSSPVASVAQDQFAMLVQLVQALLQLVQGLLGGLLSAVPPQQLSDRTVTPVLRVVPPSNPLEATSLPRQHGIEKLNRHCGGKEIGACSIPSSSLLTSSILSR